MLEPKELYPFNPNAASPVFVHRKRGTRYRKLLTYLYVDAPPAYDMDALLLMECKGDTVLIKADSPDLQTRLDLNQIPRYKGLLQCFDMVLCFTRLVMYADIDSKKIWFRPESEFNDGRFEKV